MAFAVKKKKRGYLNHLQQEKLSEIYFVKWWFTLDAALNNHKKEY